MIHTAAPSSRGGVGLDAAAAPLRPPLQRLSPEDGTKVSPPLYCIFYLYLVFVSSSGLMVLAHEFKSISMQMYSVGCA